VEAEKHASGLSDGSDDAGSLPRTDTAATSDLAFGRFCSTFTPPPPFFLPPFVPSLMLFYFYSYLQLRHKQGVGIWISVIGIGWTGVFSVPGFLYTQD
jgi:hypothetical protein